MNNVGDLEQCLQLRTLLLGLNTDLLKHTVSWTSYWAYEGPIYLV